ncbi:MAG: hypothetical protein ACRCY8_12825 [Dermatophilaceae bacterium]
MSTPHDPQASRTDETAPTRYQDTDMTDILPVRPEGRAGDTASTTAVPTTGPTTAPAHDRTTVPPARQDGPADPVPAMPTTGTPTPATPTPPTYRTGPAPVALVIGLLGLVLAASVLLTEVTDLGVPWDDVGPWSVVVAGAVVLLVGTLGLRSSRSRG